MKLIRTAFVSTSKHFTAAARKNRGHLRFNVLFLSAMILTGAAWVALAQLPEERFPWNSLPTKDRKGCRISGQVTILGRPVSQGEILFSCQTTPVKYAHYLSEIAPVSVPIIDGEYCITEDHPLIPGLYLVTIQTPEERSSPANPSTLPIWCDRSEGAVRFRAGRRLLIQVDDSSSQIFHFELENDRQGNFRDIH